MASANLRRLAEAGARIAAGTDAGNIGTLHGPSIYRELRLMVDAGMTPAQVLSAATLGGARVMGREADLGTLAAGKLADLLILDGDPTADLGVLEAPREVVKGWPHPQRATSCNAPPGRPRAELTWRPDGG